MESENPSNLIPSFLFRNTFLCETSRSFLNVNNMSVLSTHTEPNQNMSQNKKRIVLPRKAEENSNKTTSLVTLIVGFVGATIAIVVSNLTLTNKAIGALALAFVGYAVYNELDKYFAKITSRARKNSEAKENFYLQLLRMNNMSVLFTLKHGFFV